MVTLGALWLPILVSAVIVWVVSAMVWMMMPHHKKDFGKIENEDAVMDLLRGKVEPGMYYFPYVGDGPGADEYKEAVNRGPVGILRIRSAEATLNMGGNMIKSFILYVVIGIFVAYVASRTLPVGTDYMTVFQVVSTITFMAHSFGVWQESIWFAMPGKIALKHCFDGLVYALLTAGVFGWMWPA